MSSALAVCQLELKPSPVLSVMRKGLMLAVATDENAHRSQLVPEELLFKLWSVPTARSFSFILPHPR